MKTLFFLFFLMTASICNGAVQSDDFDSLMGKNTAHWSHIQQVEDRAAIEKYRALYEKNKHHQLGADSYKIPKVIHFIWLGPRPFPAESVENVRNWKALHPDWTIKFWTDRDRPLPCDDIQKCFVSDFTFDRLGPCFEDSVNWGEKSDILRYEILYQEGGVYCDHDADCLRSFENLHQGYDFYCGLETPHPPFVQRCITSGNGVIGARAHHPVVAKVIDLIARDWKSLGHKFRGHDQFSRAELVMQRTYIALTRALQEAVDQEDNVDIVFPAAYFFAKSGLPSLYSKHYFANSWAEEGPKRSDFEKFVQKSMHKLKHKNQSLELAIMVLVILNLALFASLLILKFKRLKYEK